MIDLDPLLTRQANPEPPTGLEQRLLARLSLASTLSDVPEVCHLDRSGAEWRDPFVVRQATIASLFTTNTRLTTPRSATSTWTALALHAATILLIAVLLTTHHALTTPKTATLTQLQTPAPLPPIAPRQESLGGGGGQHGPTPVTQGHLPKLAETQLLPPKAPPTVAPKLALEPTVVVQPNLKLADNKMPDLGMPNSNLKGFSLGDGSGTGIGAGNGSGIGPGSGGNMGGGVLHIGGAVLAPKAIFTPEPDYSEAARKAKFSGNVEVYLIVDEHGNPTQVRCVRDIGMGLGEKAVEAVRQYKFKPATQNGKPVKVDMYVDVNFQIF